VIPGRARADFVRDLGQRGHDQTRDHNCVIQSGEDKREHAPILTSSPISSFGNSPTLTIQAERSAARQPHRVRGRARSGPLRAMHGVFVVIEGALAD
jgi:hypothetical protein